MSVRLLQAGMQSSLQDGGRIGYQHEGVPAGGVMDTFNFRLANLLVGNMCNAAVIEFSGFGAMLIPDIDLVIALCGGGSQLTINQVQVPSYRPVFVKAFSVIQLLPLPTGYRSYFAIQGGFKGQSDLASVSTYPTAGLGGIDGKYLKAGNVIEVHKHSGLKDLIFSISVTNSFKLTHWGIAEQYYQDIFSNQIRIVKGPEWDFFEKEMADRLLTDTFIISDQSNRMGYRLNGPEIIPKKNDELISSAVTAGIIQCTQNGGLLLLMADAQTTGGYPRIAKIVDVDIARCAQMKPGSKIHFQLISSEEAEQLYLEREMELQVLKNIISISYY